MAVWPPVNHQDVTDKVDSVVADVTAVRTTADGAIQKTEKAAAGGVATLDTGGKVPEAQLPPISSASNRGFVIYTTNGVGGYNLRTGETDDGVAARWYDGPDDPTLIAGHVARENDKWFKPA